MVEFTVDRKSNHVLVVVTGKIDDEAKAPFDDRLHPIIAEAGQRMIIDLSGVKMITSMGIAQLVTLVSRANTNGSSVILAALSPFVKSVIQATKLDQFFQLADSVEQAESRFAET